MRSNRSIPDTAVMPELAYDDVPAAAAWLCGAFGFAERLRIADHRVQLAVGTGAMVVVQRQPAPGEHAPSHAASHDHSVMVRVDDVDAHFRRADSHGARIVRPPADHPYGERQYTAVDLGGHAWTFTQTIADVDPADWGGVLMESGA